PARQLRSCFSKVWIACQRLSVKRVGTIVGVRGQTTFGLAKLILTSQIKIVCLRVALFVGGKRNGKLDLERVNNCASDFILQRKHALQFAFVSFRPKLKTVSRIN